MYYEAETQFHEWLGETLPQHLPETGQMLFISLLSAYKNAFFMQKALRICIDIYINYCF